MDVRQPAQFPIYLTLTHVYEICNTQYKNSLHVCVQYRPFFQVFSTPEWREKQRHTLWAGEVAVETR